MHVTVLHLFKFFAALVERASKPATPTFLSALRAAHPSWLRLRRFVGQPILAAAGFQPAFTRATTCASAREGRPKAGCRHDCRQDCPPRKTRRTSDTLHQLPPQHPFTRFRPEFPESFQ